MPVILSLMLAAFQQDKDTQQNQNKRQCILGIFIQIKAIKVNNQKNDAYRGNKPALDGPNFVNQRADADNNQQNRPGLTKAVTGGLADKD